MDPCDLPWDEQQVSQLKQRLKSKRISIAGRGAMDELTVVMHRAFMEDDSKIFIRAWFLL